MKHLEFITCTGIDDKTDFEWANDIANKYPIEWGVLIGHGENNRFPKPETIDKLFSISGQKSAHLCGKAARDFILGRMPKDIDLSRFDRIQINGYHKGLNPNLSAIEDLGVQLIIQTKDTFQDQDRVHQLFDPSGGRGLTPDVVPSLGSTSKLVGYSGGIGPLTIHNYVNKIKGAGRFWLDMESAIRTDDWFDLRKVEMACLQIFEKPRMPEVYRLKKLKGGSDKYGLCECCGKTADPIYLLVTYRTREADNGQTRYYYHEDKYGHLECLSELTEK